MALSGIFPDQSFDDIVRRLPQRGKGYFDSLIKVMSFAKSAALSTVENHRHGERFCPPVLRQPVKQFFPALRKVPQLNPGQGLVKSDQIIPVNYYLNRHKAPKCLCKIEEYLF